MESRILVFSEDRAATVELFNNTLIRKHARVASIERMGRGTSDRLGFYGYNFFQPTTGGDTAILNLVWHFGDKLETIESLFTDLSTFRGHTLESIYSIKCLFYDKQKVPTGPQSTGCWHFAMGAICSRRSCPR